jgi:membrane-bound lytic murein transglycosylase MltF
VIGVLIPFSRTLFYTDKGRERGMTAELVRHWERYLNKKYAQQLGKRPLTVCMAPTTRDKLLPEVVGGLGDIAAGNITVTEARQETVDFVSPPSVRTVNEVVVVGPKAPAVASADDLAGKTVHVRKASSYYESLVALNERFAKEGKPAAKLVLLPDALADEDAMEMLNAGLLDILIVDDWKANVWAQALPKIKVIRGAVVRSGGHVGWAIRKDSPKLVAEIMDFYTNHLVKQGVIGSLHAQALKRAKQIKNNTTDEELKRFEEMLALFRKVMPATGAQLKVGDITVTESNIHAGTKYMDQLMTKYFTDAKFTGSNRALFAFASYNCGPGNVSRMRRLAKERGLEPDKWFNNVEIVTAEKIRGETTNYVRNIYKYYVAYRLTLDAAEAQQKLKEQMQKGG